MRAKGKEAAARSPHIVLGGCDGGERNPMSFLTDEERETCREAARIMLRKEREGELDSRRALN